ncbi:hypothetical protein CIL05_05155 [Virgibacillus profundi]|uniref:Uncharacterized protein n=1 Tax=Virgibacillus profundi TaxID=2024555 RepID=A0A2A2IGW8_9BACI|nr:hypothetical protein [Virgibacillus profundi]PAV30494.1 hypothetical protein CIL05_05155 [Virgibacillus profundi]PXY54666.1 hypothetical protein CIT14_05240 [Virgibacillus profundi]
MDKFNSKKFPFYLYTKLIGAGFSFSVFIVFMTFMISFDLFELSELLSNPLLWAAFYVYAILCSIIIDGIIKLWPKLKSRIVLLYIFAGCIVFAIPMYHIIYFLIAGSIGAAAALLFYYGMKIIKPRFWLSIIFAIGMPILFIVISIVDFTDKENWVEERNSFGFESTFDYFHGEHKIPIDLEKGEVIIFQVNIYDESGGWGYHFEDEKGNHAGMESRGEKSAFEALEDGEYYIVLHGDEAKGRFEVDWEISRE